MTTKTTQTLPRIIAMISKTDAGEFGATTCPHCGADGRYVWTFLCDDGTTRGAMAGCLQRFPKSRLVDEHKKIIERAAEREQAGRSLASWDENKLAAINEVIAGTLTEQAALDIVATENLKRSAWLRKHGYGR